MQPAEQAFLRDIIEHPDDDAPRLVYADWLDERGGKGDSARAAFIRVQCELARLDEFDPRRPDLEAQQRRLLSRRRTTWAGGLPRWALQRDFGYRRGFVAELTATVRELDRSAGALWRAAPIEAADLHRAAEDLDVLVAAPWLARLTDLRLGGSVLTAGHVRRLAASPHLGRLVALDLDGSWIGNQGVAALARSPRLERLSRLVLDNTYLGLPGVRALAESPHLTRLRHLDLSTNNLDARAVAALAGAPCPELTSLNLARTRLGSAGVEELVASPLAARLRRLDLTAARIGPAGALALAGAPALAGLRSLGVAFNALDEVALRALVESPHLAGLRELRVGTGINRALRQVLRGRFGAGLRFGY